MKKRKHTIVLPEKLSKEAQAVAEKTGRTFSGLIKISLEEELKKNGLEKDKMQNTDHANNP